MSSISIPVHNWQGETVAEAHLHSSIFGVPVRKDIITRVVLWQLAKRRSGNHKTKGVSDVSGTTRKPYRQKGTGRARQGSLRSPQFRGGGVIFGPVVRDHGYSLQKKVRRLGLKCILADKLQSGQITILDSMAIATHKTKDVKKIVGKSSALLVKACDDNVEYLQKAISNLIGIDIIAEEGLNVYDIMRHDRLIMTQATLHYLEKRLCVGC